MIRNRNVRSRFFAVVFLLFSLIAAGACGEDKEVGGGIEAEGGGEDGAIRDPERTTTTEGAAAATTTTAKATTTTRGITTTTRQVLDIKIQDDQQGKPFEPQVVTTRAGRLVRWTNVGNTERSVIADNNAFRSPPIKPGGTFEWVARPGQYNYTDGVRPYATGTLNVQ